MANDTMLAQGMKTKLYNRVIDELNGGKVVEALWRAAFDFADNKEDNARMLYVNDRTEQIYSDTIRARFIKVTIVVSFAVVVSFSWHYMLKSQMIEHFFSRLHSGIGASQWLFGLTEGVIVLLVAIRLFLAGSKTPSLMTIGNINIITLLIIILVMVVFSFPAMLIAIPVVAHNEAVTFFALRNSKIIITAYPTLVIGIYVAMCLFGRKNKHLFVKTMLVDVTRLQLDQGKRCD